MGIYRWGGGAVEETEMTMVAMMGGEPFWRVRGTDKGRGGAQKPFGGRKEEN